MPSIIIYILHISVDLFWTYFCCCTTMVRWSKCTFGHHCWNILVYTYFSIGKVSNLVWSIAFLFFSCASSLAMVGFLKHSRQVVEPTIFTLFCSKFELNISTHTNMTSQTLCFVCGTCMNTVEVISQSKMLDGTLLFQSYFFLFLLRKLNCPFCA